MSTSSTAPNSTAPSATPALDITDVTRSFGSALTHRTRTHRTRTHRTPANRTLANDAVSLRVQPGEVVGLLGHNGAGKTTLVSQIVGLLKPDSGSIRIQGLDAIAHPAKARRCVAIQTQAQAPLDGLTPQDAIEISCRLRGMSRGDARRSTLALAEELDIGEWLTHRATPEGGGLSGGLRRLTAFAMAVAAPVPLVILDEPTNDVDAARRRLLWRVVRRLGDQGTGVLLVTHNVIEAERVVDSLAILDRGKVVAAGTPSQLRGSTDSALRLELSLSPGDGSGGEGGSDGADPPPAFAAPPVPATRVVRHGRRILVTIAATDAAAAVGWAHELRAAGRIESYALTPATLEDVYLAVTEANGAGRVTNNS